MKRLTQKDFDVLKGKLKHYSTDTISIFENIDKESIEFVDKCFSFEIYNSIYKAKKEVELEQEYIEETKKANEYVWIREKTIQDLWEKMETLEKKLDEVISKITV